MQDYDDTPGTYVFDGRRSLEGYHWNMLCMSLIDEANRKRFAADAGACVDGFPMSDEQRRALEHRDCLAMLRLEGQAEP